MYIVFLENFSNILTFEFYLLILIHDDHDSQNPGTP